MNRRDFTRLSVLAASAAFIPAAFLYAAPSSFTSQRPVPSKRKFISESVDALIEEVKKNIHDAELAWMFENCFPNTLDTTVFYETKNGVPDSYVITGDIDAMWLRDSSAQVNPYLPLCKDDKHLSNMVEGLIRRQTRCILLDPYANAFYKDESKVSPWRSDLTEMKPGVHERKYELDSLCYCLRLAYQYWRITGNDAPFDDEWFKAMKLVVATMQEQQRKNGKGSYHFQRLGGSKTDTLKGSGYGNPINPTGMICTAFRNSDDAAVYLFNIPENFFAISALKQMQCMLWELRRPGMPELHESCTKLTFEIEAGIRKFGTAEHPKHGKIFVYECDGLGNNLMMEDAGIPGLVTIPYITGPYLEPLKLLNAEGKQRDTSEAPFVNWTEDDHQTYLRSRQFALSPDNKYFFVSPLAEGVGSPHLERKGNMIWPMGIISRAITSNDNTEIAHCLKMLKDTQAGTGFMHEGFKANNPANFTRSWFAWANSYFGEMIWKIYREKGELL